MANYDDGVVIFTLPIEKVKKLHIRGKKVVDTDYQLSKSSEVMKIKIRRFKI